jgi:hypothetical protein
MVRGGRVAVAGWQFLVSLESAFQGGHFGAKMTLWRCVFIELWSCAFDSMVILFVFHEADPFFFSFFFFNCH